MRARPGASATSGPCALDADVDELYVAPIGPHDRQMIERYAREVVPAVA